MKIIFLSQYDPPESNAPAVRTSEMAERWAKAGHDVTVITAFPHHPAGVIQPEYRGRTFMREEKNGVHLVRTFIYVAANKGVIKRSLSYLSWMCSAMILGALRVKRPDVIVATSPQFLCAVAGFALAKIKRVTFVMEVRDLWPDSVVAVGALREGLIVRCLRAIERFLYRHSDQIVVVSPGFQSHIEAAGVFNCKIALLPNGVDLQIFAPGRPADALYREHGVIESFRILYTGTVGMAHGLETVLDAAERLRDVAFVIIGDGARRTELTQQAQMRKLSNIYFIAMQPRATMPEWIRGADVALVHLKATPLFETVLPSKLFEYMGCGRAVLMGVRGAAAQIVTDANCGWLFSPGSSRELVSLIERLRDEPEELERRGRNGRQYVEKYHDRDRLAERYAVEILRPLIDAHA